MTDVMVCFLHQIDSPMIGTIQWHLVQSIEYNHILYPTDKEKHCKSHNHDKYDCCKSLFFHCIDLVHQLIELLSNYNAIEIKMIKHTCIPKHCTPAVLDLVQFGLDL